MGCTVSDSSIPNRHFSTPFLTSSLTAHYIDGHLLPKGANMLEGFKKFILRGNVVDMAVGVVMGAAFGGVVTALTKDLLTPLIAAVVGKPDFSAIHFNMGSTSFPIGDFINSVVSFLLIAVAIYFFVVTPVNALLARMKKEPPADPTTKKCPECLSEIPIDAKRCAHCAQLVPVERAAA